MKITAILIKRFVKLEMGVAVFTFSVKTGMVAGAR